MKAEILERFNKVYFYHYDVLPGNRVDRRDTYYTEREIRNSGHICVMPNYCDPVDELKSRTDLWGGIFHDKIELGKKIFISSKCRMPRDLARKSYQITLSKDKADYIVVPRVKKIPVRYANIIVKSATDNIYLITYNDLRMLESPGDSAIKLVLDDCLDNSDVVLMSGSNARPVWFIPNIDEYVEILDGDQRNYVSDNKLPLIPDNKVSTQTLDMWRRMAASDFNMFEKSLINSDAGNYPLTTYIFLKVEGYFWSYSEQTKWFLRSIGIDVPRQMDLYEFNDRLVSVDDWKMLSDWLMFNFGVSESGGFADLSSSKYSNFADLFRRKLAVAPKKIDKPITFRDIQNC